MTDSRPKKVGTNLFYNYVNNNKGWDNFSLSPLFTVTNYLTAYHNWLINKNLLQAIPLDYVEILDAFTQFELRVVEQAILSRWKCELNSTQIVNFSFINWNPNTTLRNLGVSYEILDEDKTIIMTLSSANVASGVLGVPQTTLRRYTNLSLHKLYSPILEKFVYIVDPTRPLSLDNPKFSTG